MYSQRRSMIRDHLEIAVLLVFEVTLASDGGLNTWFNLTWLYKYVQSLLNHLHSPIQFQALAFLLPTEVLHIYAREIDV